MTSLLWRFYIVLLYFRLRLAKKVENPNFFALNPICLKFGIGGNFEMLITKVTLNWDYKTIWEEKMHFSTDFSQNFTEHPSTIALPWPTVIVPWDWLLFRIQAY